jgi:predicted glycoside hydrolase/deacetylase ChbG (UPF0249 family)
MTSTHRTLRVTADDYGLAHGVNAGIAELVARGAVSTVSVMVHPNAELTQLSSLDGHGAELGLHLVFVDERPLLPVSEMRPLLTPDDRFIKYRALFRRLMLRPALCNLLRREAEAQVDRYLGLGLPLRFINSHQHVHMFPPIWRALMPLFRRLTTSWIRSGALGPVTPTKQGLVNLSSRVACWRDPLPVGRLVAPLGVIHVHPLTPKKVDRALRAWLAGRGPTCSAELVVHPALEDEDLRRCYGHWRFRWQQEYEQLVSDQWRAVFEQHSVKPAGDA